MEPPEPRTLVGDAENPTARIRGRIRRIKQGFGFIAGDDGIDYFFHRFGFRKSSSKQFVDCAEQDRLEFTPCYPGGGKGPRAIELTYIDG